jgi:hypothetical protein
MEDPLLAGFPEGTSGLASAEKTTPHWQIVEYLAEDL